MNRQLAFTAASVWAVVGCFALPGRAQTNIPPVHSLPPQPPTTQAQTGELDLTFTQRSPLSMQKEIARRLNTTPAKLGDDYDLSKCPFKAYIPTNYDPATAHGLFVYLGYKNTVATPPLWHPLLEKYHLIFVSPICHSGKAYAPSVPDWESMGLSLDAVFNLEKQFNIDGRRVYLMSWADQGPKISMATADVFTGFIVALPLGYMTRINLPGGRYYPPAFVPPIGELESLSKNRPFFLIDDGNADNVQLITLIAGAMHRNDFAHVTTAALSTSDDLHYPNLKAEWFEQQALPFLEKSATAPPVAKSIPVSSTTQPAVNEPQHLLGMAQLYISNGQTDLAQKKLQQIIDTYPNDPASTKARELLGQLSQ